MESIRSKAEPQIAVSHLFKTYRVPERGAGLAASIRSLFRRTYRDVEAVHDASFRIEAGEMVGLIGPNGAGKTTTLKMLSGLLHPTSGEAHVAGFVPWERKAEYLRRISMVLGNKSQLLWDVPALDTFQMLAEIYSVPPSAFQQTLDELIELLDLGDLLFKPVGRLSLGERMKCELVAGLLYRPAVLFLDEPTLGLDVSMQRRLRGFLGEYNHRTGATVLLTSHYMADVIELCSRVILIHHGQVLYDGDLAGLAERLAPFRLLRLSLEGGYDNTCDHTRLPAGVSVVEHEKGRLVLRVPRAEAPGMTAHLLQTLPVADLTVEEPPIEAVIDQIYQKGSL